MDFVGMTVIEALSARLQHDGPEHCLLECAPGKEPRGVTARQLWDEVAALAGKFAALGISRRQKVLLFLDNSIEYIESFLALLRLGAVPVIAQQDYRRLELEEVFSNSQPRAVILEEHCVAHLREYLRDMLVVARGNNGFQLVQNGAGSAASTALPDETAGIHYTYRGYGYPLGALVPHGQYLSGAEGFEQCVQFQKGEVLLPVLPFSHMFSLVGCILLSLLYGIKLIISRSLSPRSIFELIREQRINYLISVPDMLLLLSRLIDKETAFPSLRLFVSGGSLLRPEDQTRIEQAFGVELLNGYGLTEFTPVTGNIRGESKKGSIGLPIQSIQARIAKQEAGRIGEICIRSEDMTKAYYRRPDETREATADGWFHTGDLGYSDHGHFVFEREQKETRKIHGSMVDLNEVRRAIALVDPALPAKVELSHGSLVARLGIPMAVDFKEKVAELRLGLRQSIAGYKIPKDFLALE